MALLPDGVQPAVFEEVLQRGRDRGVLTQEDLVEVVREVELTPEVIEQLVSRVGDEGIQFNAEDHALDGDDGAVEDRARPKPRRTAPTEPKPSPNGTRSRAASTRSRSQSNGEYASSGAAEDPVHTYLKEIGKVELLSAELEVEMAKRVEEGLAAAARLAALEGEGDASVE
ncbi:MAG TPA: sigma-70 factor domain-containing protein, partial [Acidimicrobiia bacterium]|nr:sigma-70 factor domain-containing protein [Acidimicrobiia bacterium]